MQNLNSKLFADLTDSFAHRKHVRAVTSFLQQQAIPLEYMEWSNLDIFIDCVTVINSEYCTEGQKQVAKSQLRTWILHKGKVYRAENIDLLKKQATHCRKKTQDRKARQKRLARRTLLKNKSVNTLEKTQLYLKQKEQNEQARALRLIRLEEKKQKSKS